MKKNLLIIFLFLLNLLSCYLVVKLEYKTRYIKHYIERRKGIVQEKRPADLSCIEGWTNTIAKLDYDADIVFFGHSHITDSDFRQYFPDKKIVNLGYPGNNLKGMLSRIEQIDLVKPEKVFIMGGANSLWYSKEEFESAYDTLITNIRNKIPNAELYLINILPQCNGEKGNALRNVTIRSRNRFIDSYATLHDFKMIDVYSLYVDEKGNLVDSLSNDGLHLKASAYDKWAECLIPYMQ